MEATEFDTNIESAALTSGSAGSATSRLASLSPGLGEKLLTLANRGGDGVVQPKRDLSAALDLINEAFGAIRIAEERAVAAEDQRQKLVQHHKDQMRALESRLAACERRLETSEHRAEAAEQRAEEAEEWLSRFHDTIMDRFQRAFVD